MRTKAKTYTVKDAAKELDVTEQTIRTYLKDGELKGRQMGRMKKWIIPDAEIRRFKKKYAYGDL